MIAEPYLKPIAGVRDVIRDVGWVYFGTAVVAFIFSCTGPVAIIISVGLNGGLTEAEIGSWIAAGCVFSGLVTIWFSLAYRQPLSFAWTIPGTVLLASALNHLSFAEVIGAYWVTAALLTVIGLSGGVRRAMRYVPMPIVLAMVAGIFLQFGLNVIFAFEQELLLAACMVITYFVGLAIPRLGASIPPVVLSLIAGCMVVVLTGGLTVNDNETIHWLVLPVLHWPQFTQQAIFELVIPLAVTVLVAQNGQGFAVLLNGGHKPPFNLMTIACGLGSGINAVFGSVSMCVTGPANAVLVSSGNVVRQYTAGVIFGLLNIVFGVLAFAATWLILKLPAAFIAVLSGLALLPVLQRAFVTAFSGKFAMSALITLLVTVSDITIWNIGAPFWGLVSGLISAFLIERRDITEHLNDSLS